MAAASSFLLCGTLSCTNIVNGRNASSSTGTTVIASSTIAGSSTNTFTIKTIVPDTFNPTTALDVLGDGSGTLGTLCQTLNASHQSVCSCTYSYTPSGGSAQQVDTQVTYVESDMLRCTYYEIVPSSISTMQVSIHLTSADTYSNALNFILSSGSSTLNTSDPNSFTPVYRYQCRDVFYIPGILDPNVYDPIQSEDPHLSYPINFYTANFGNALSHYIQANASGSHWSCPPILSPSLFLSAAAATTFSSNYHLNMDVFSKAGLSPSGSKTIFPHTPGTFDRSTFYLAKQASGSFKIPLNVRLAPNVITASSSAPGPIGYGASPIVTGTHTESCPDSSTTSIPAGYHWVKVWLFRASLSQRTYATSSGLAAVKSISCNPGDWLNPGNTSGGYGPVFTGCDLGRYDVTHVADPSSSTDMYLGTSYTLTQASNTINGDIDIPLNTLAHFSAGTPAHYLVDRVLGTGECVRLDSIFDNHFTGSPVPTGYGVCTTNIPQFGAGAGAGCVGADLWQAERPFPYNQRAPFAAPSVLPTPYNCSSIDPLNTCSSLAQASIPYNGSITATSLESLLAGDGGTITPRYDFLFVVSPTSIMLSDMQNSTTASMPYQPFRYYTDLDCLSSDPDAPLSSTDCSLANAITNYGLKLHDVNTNGDPPATDQNRAGIFPICALQPDS